MSEDFINTLPTELLCQVFDLLEFRDQLHAMRICTTWSSILSDYRFASGGCFSLTSYVTKGGNLDDLKSLPITAFKVDSTYNSSDEIAIQKFLRSEEVSRSAEELRLEFFRFGNRKIHLPMLKRLILMGMSKEDTEKVIAPALNHVEVYHCIDAEDRVGCIPSVEKLVTLKLWIPEKFAQSLKDQSLNNLRHLEIYGHEAFLQSDIDHWKLIVRQLTYFKVGTESWSREAFNALWSILPEAKNLRVMSLSVLYIQLMRLVPQLRELTLEANHEYHDFLFRPQEPYTQCGHFGPIHMPNLIKLTTMQNVIHVLITPKLRMLTIEANRDSRMEPAFLHRLSDEWSTICSQLSAIRISTAKFTNSDVMTLCNLSSLQIMELSCNIEHSEVDLILEKLQSKQQLQRVRFHDCTWISCQRGCKGIYNRLVQRYPEIRDLGRLEDDGCEQSLHIKQSYFYRTGCCLTRR